MPPVYMCHDCMIFRRGRRDDVSYLDNVLNSSRTLEQGPHWHYTHSGQGRGTQGPLERLGAGCAMPLLPCQFPPNYSANLMQELTSDQIRSDQSL